MEALLLGRVSHGPDRLSVTFDDHGLVGHAGLILVATLAARLGLGDLVDSTVRLGDRPGGSRQAGKS